MSKNHAIVVLLDRNGFSVFQDTLTAILRFNFSPETVSNLDILNRERFSSLVSSFISANKITPSSLTVVLTDDAVYEKDLSQSSQVLASNAGALAVNDKQQEEIQKFLENVPFEDVLAKVIRTEKMVMAVGTNKNLITAITESFSNAGFIAEAVIPGFLYGPGLNFSKGLTPENAQAVLQRGEILRLGNLLMGEKETLPQSPNLGEEVKQKKPQNIRTYILVAVFVFLLIILMIVYFVSKAQPAAKKNTAGSSLNSSAVPSPVLTIAPTVSSSQTPNTEVPDPKSIKVKIVQNPQSQGLADILKAELLKIGFENIASEISANSPSIKSSVLFSSSVFPVIRQNVVTEVKKIIPDILFLESEDSEPTITIILGKF